MRNFIRQVVVFLCFALPAVMQAQDTTIVVKGTATDPNGRPIQDLLIVNQRTYMGSFGNSDGTFRVSVRKNDTLQFGGMGFKSFTISYADSTYKPEYTLKLNLDELIVEVGEATVFAPRELSEIQQDIEELGFDDRDYRTSGVDALSSPITFLYERFSRRAQNKRQVMEMENDDRRRELLKELFQKYVSYDIIQLSDEDFDEFIDFLNVSDHFLQNTTQYDFILYVKDRYKAFRKRNRQLDYEDYQYHED